MGKGLLEPSMETATSFALGARKRNVTLRSAWTSGETSGGGCVCDLVFCDEAVKVRNRIARVRGVRFMVHPAPLCCGVLEVRAVAPRHGTSFRVCVEQAGNWASGPAKSRVWC